MPTKTRPTAAKPTAAGEDAPAKKLSANGHRLPPNAGKGRKKGSLNKENKLLREMILLALDRVGGVEYLAQQAEAEPKAFLGLLGRVLPLQVSGEGGGAIHVTISQKYADVM